MPPEHHPCRSTYGRASNHFGAFPPTATGNSAEPVTVPKGGIAVRQDADFRTGRPA
jgi:hypothetical protein